MDRELTEHVMIERGEMIARLAAEGTCQERDREIALGLIAEIAKGKPLKSKEFTVVFSVFHVNDKADNSYGIE
ncbi:Tum protein [Cronobacter sakazakii]|nr:Tum protein [Cronobacter sakazakii]